MDDILGLGKILPMDKLVDVLREAVGALAKPYLDKRAVDVEAYKIEKLAIARAKAMGVMSGAVRENSTGVEKLSYNDSGINIESTRQIQAQDVHQLPTSTLEDRTKARIEFQEARRQLNIESITGFAAAELENEPPVTDQPIDDNWTSRFFKYAEDISEESMQAIWGRILAGEVKQPNTYSLRTLEVLRNLSKHEAEIFEKAANLALEVGGESVIFKSHENNFLQKFGLDFMDVSVLREAGLVHEGDLTNYNFRQEDEVSRHIFSIKNIVVFVNRKPLAPLLPMPIYIFTQVGTQILKLINPTPSQEYLNSFATFIESNETTVEYAFLLGRQGVVFHHTTPLLQFPMS